MRQNADKTGDLIETIGPRFDWDDAGFSEGQRRRLEDLCGRAGGPPRAAARRGPQVLFTGPPGSGKTLAAQLVAGRLDLDLYRIDLAAVVSKYIGETEKNLDHIFSKAMSRDAVLLLDEAGALFGKRSDVEDAHGRHAKSKAAHLLERLETYPGLAILATNHASDLDEAVLGRLEVTIEFSPSKEGESR